MEKIFDVEDPERNPIQFFHDMVSMIESHDFPLSFGKKTPLLVWKRDGFYGDYGKILDILEINALRDIKHRNGLFAEHLIGEARKYQGILDSLLWQEGDPENLLLHTWKYYYTQQLLRVAYGRAVTHILSVLDLSLIHVDKTPSLHSRDPYHISLSRTGYRETYGRRVTVSGKPSDDFLESLKGMGWDYIKTAVISARIFAEITYFAQTENNYTYSCWRWVHKYFTWEDLLRLLPLCKLTCRGVIWKNVQRNIKKED